MEARQLEDGMECSQEYNLLKEVYRTVKRQAFLVRIDKAERNLAAGKTKAMSVDDFIRETSISITKCREIGKLNTPAKLRVYTCDWLRVNGMKPKSINFDSVFEKHWHKYLAGLTEKQK